MNTKELCHSQLILYGAAGNIARYVAVVAKFFRQNVPPAPANCTVSGPTRGVPDGKINISDVALVAKHYGEHE
jgi:hypothetical protein